MPRTAGLASKPRGLVAETEVAIHRPQAGRSVGLLQSLSLPDDGSPTQVRAASHSRGVLWGNRPTAHRPSGRYF